MLLNDKQIPRWANGFKSDLITPQYKAVCRINANLVTMTTSQRETGPEPNVTVVLQLGVLLGSPLLNGPVPVGQHLRADFDDASQSTATQRAARSNKAIRTQIVPR